MVASGSSDGADFKGDYHAARRRVGELSSAIEARVGKRVHRGFFLTDRDSLRRCMPVCRLSLLYAKS